jgi:hypothetical protein
MALIPLNTFKTKTAILTTSSTSTIYTAPVGVTSIVLMAQVANVTTQTATVTFGHYRNLPILSDSQGNGFQTGTVFTELIKNFGIPGNDGANLVSGKMIIETLDSIRAFSSVDGRLKITLSILETANA